MKKILIINGPNLNLLGNREDDIYGKDSLDKIKSDCEKKVIENELEIIFFQSNNEGEIIDKLQEVGFSLDGIILNAAAYTHTSVGIADAIAAIKTPVIEVHISNIHSREEFRHNSLISKNVKGIVCGFGLQSYELALKAFL